MLVNELISELSKFNKSDFVYFSYDSGDYWDHIIAGKITSVDYKLIDGDYTVESDWEDEEDADQYEAVTLNNDGYSKDTMTVDELINELRGCNSDDEVYFEEPQGDYWNRHEFEEVVELSYEQIIYSDYHQKYKLVSHDSELENSVQALVLRSFC
ncbi:MAG: hypothetical protein R3321_00390 [Nitrososphaeraceae archaeon]|nr:hypothetical protein [Nitrososphaeraceae archaeon]